MLKAVERINAAIKAGVPEKTVGELMSPDAQLPVVYPGAADLYQRELASLQQQSPEVRLIIPGIKNTENKENLINCSTCRSVRTTVTAYRPV